MFGWNYFTTYRVETENMSVSPYQFEPVKKKKKSDSDDEWEDIEDVEGDDEVVEVTADLEEHLQRLSRIDSEPSGWCKCKYCKTMPVNQECLCCV